VAENPQDRLALRALRPMIVDVDPEVVDELLREEQSMERRSYTKMASHGGESSPNANKVIC